MRCKYCGKPLDDDAAFCKYCGEHCAPPQKRPASGRTQPTAGRRPAAGARPAAPSGRQTSSANRPNPAPRRKPVSREPEPVSVLDQMPKWVIPTICITAAALLIVGAVFTFLNAHQDDFRSSLDAPPETDIIMTDPPTETPTETETETEAETLPETTDAVFDSDSPWAQSYYAAILDFEKANREVSPNAIKYRLLYINDDETPELFMQAGDNSSLYTIMDDEAKVLCEAKRQSDERIQGILTRRGTFLTYSKDDDNECYKVYRLRSGEINPIETYLAEDSSYTIDGASVDLVEFTQHVRAKQAVYQFTGCPQYNKSDLLDALKRAVDGEDIPEMAPEEADMVIETIDPDSIDDEKISRTGTARFEVFSGAYTWSEAQAKCKAKGGHLAYIKSESDYNAVLDAIKKADSGLTYLWVGGKTTITDSGVTASWNDGSSTRYLDDEKLWFGHEPSGKDGDIREPYMMLWNPNGERWSFNDNSDSCVKIYAAGTMGYVCEFDE